MKKTIYSSDNYKKFLGKEVAVSKWYQVTQKEIDLFAALTGDHQWIHTDVDRAKASSYGSTIAHGLLILSLTYVLTKKAKGLPGGFKKCVNYGFDRVRFPTPVPSGKRIRCRIRLTSIKKRAKGEVLLTHQYTMEIKGEKKPALVADCIGLFSQQE